MSTRRPNVRPDDERDRLVNDNVKLAEWAVGVFLRRIGARARHYPPDVARCDALAGLARAAELFDPAVGVRFSTYAVKGMESRMRRGLTEAMHLRGKGRRVRFRPLPLLVALAPPDHRTPGPHDAAEAAEEAAHAARLVTAGLAAIPRRQARAVRLVRLQGLTLAAAGRRMGGISRERVRQLVAKGLAGIREALAGEGGAS